MRTLGSSRTLVAVLAVAALWLLAPRAEALPETSLMISEVFLDPVGGNNNRQWVELYNAGTMDIVLTGNYSLGYGRTDYTRTTVALVGTILAGQMFVVGGTISDALSFNPTYDQSINFTPDPRLGDNNNFADGVALFNLPAASIAPLSNPIHTVIYGEATSAAQLNLTNESGVAGSGVLDVILPTTGIAGQSIAFNGTTWVILSTPTPGATAVPSVPEPSTALLLAFGLIGLASVDRHHRFGAKREPRRGTPTQ
jgi:hypothetical protein